MLFAIINGIRKSAITMKEMYDYPEMHGAKVSPEDLEHARLRIRELRRQGSTESGEVEKTDFQRAEINLVNNIIKEEFYELGLRGFVAIPFERVHILNEAESSVRNQKNIAGTFYNDKKSIELVNQQNIGATDPVFDSMKYRISEYAINKAKEINQEDTEGFKNKVLRQSNYVWAKYHWFTGMLHESLHYVAKEKMEVGLFEDRIRNGYRLIAKKGNYLGDYFVALNEAIIEKMALELFEKHRSEISDLFDGYQTKQDGLIFEDKYMKNSITRDLEEIIEFGQYEFEREILDSILGKIAVAKGELLTATWSRFKKGLISGEIMHIRDIEDVYGKGFLRFYASLPPLGCLEKYVEESGKDISDLVYLLRKYFETNDKEERQQAKDDIFWEFEDELKQAHDSTFVGR